jgi:deoxyadenosine/deoxycytidine kinase
MEHMLNEAKIHDYTTIAQFQVANQRLTAGQEAIQKNIKSTSHNAKMDTTRLLHICVGLTTGIQRLDDRNVRFEQKTTRQNQQLIRNQVKMEASMERISTSMKMYGTKTNIIANRMLTM